MIAKNALRVFALSAALAVVGSLGITSPADATPSAASTTSNSSSDTDGDVIITATVVGTSLAEATAKSTAKATGSSYAYAVAQGQSKAKVDRSQCEWSPGINTYWSDDVLVRDYDPVPSHVCKLKTPQTVGGYTYYWKKIGGGTSGSACNNLFVPTHQQVSYTQVVWLDVKAGTMAKIAVHSRVCVEVTATVDVTLSYTYEDETHVIHRSNSDSATKCKSDSDFAHKRITKHTSRHASAQAVARAKAKVQTRATAKARTAATATARAKAVRTVSVVIHIDQNNGPSLSATANGCVKQGETGVISGSVSNPNNEAHPFTVSSSGKSFSGTIGAQSSAPFNLNGFTPGTYDVTATLTDINLSATVRVTVNQCPPEVKHWTNVSCTSPEEITVGSGALVDCTVSNDNGTPIGLTAVSTDSNSRVSGVICRTNGTQSCPNGGTFEFRITGVHEGYSSVSVTASSNGVDKTIVLGPFPVDPENGGF